MPENITVCIIFWPNTTTVMMVQSSLATVASTLATATFFLSYRWEQPASNASTPNGKAQASSWKWFQCCTRMACFHGWWKGHWYQWWGCQCYRWEKKRQQEWKMNNKAMREVRLEVDIIYDACHNPWHNATIYAKIHDSCRGMCHDACHAP